MARTKSRKTTAKTARKKVVKRATARRAAAKPKAATKTKAAAKPKASAKQKTASRARTGKAAARPARKADPTTAMRALAQHIVDVTLADDDEAILGLYAAEIESSEAGNPPEVGIEALRAKYVGWRSMTSATAFEPRRIVVDGNVIVIEWLGHITLAASGRQVDMHEIAVHEIRDGKIARESFYYNPSVLA